jgi:integrase
LEWLPRLERNDKGLRATTVAGYKYYVAEDIAPSALGRMKLTDIRRYHVQEFVADQMKAGRGTVTVRRLVTLLGTIFASAVKDELISANPARGVGRPKLDSERLDPWEPDQVRTFLDRCAQQRLGALFEVAVLTGLRRGEITGLRWQDLALAARKVVVRRNRVTVNGRVQEQNAPKPRAGLRTVALSDFAVARLLAWQLRQAEEAEEAEAAQEAWQSEGHVFTMEDGQALDPAYITRLFQKLRKGPCEELPLLSFHGLRHCAASLMLASGADIAGGVQAPRPCLDLDHGRRVWSPGRTVASDAVNGAANLIAHTVHTPEGVDA